MEIVTDDNFETIFSLTRESEKLMPRSLGHKEEKNRQRHSRSFLDPLWLCFTNLRHIIESNL